MAKRKTIADKAEQALKDVPGISPNPMTNLVIADLVLRGGGQLLRHAVERNVLGIKFSKDKAANIIKGRSMTQTLIGTAIARIATRSVPGAILIGGGLLAKTLYDRRHGTHPAEEEGKAEIADQVDAGKKA
ncbi:MAG TPA: hypothetical protein VHG29_02185 [Novosphingobium sp.]|nr:hypothetical protein [Novosphingobium sp.]